MVQPLLLSSDPSLNRKSEQNLILRERKTDILILERLC
jgi:hypothetical protein